MMKKLMRRRLPSLLISCSLALVLTSCAYQRGVHETENNLQNAKDGMQQAHLKETSAPAALVNSGYYVDTTPVDASKAPDWLKQNITLHAEGVPFDFVVKQILRHNKGIVVNYQPQVNQSKIVSINYEGTVKGALDKLAVDTDYAYTVSDNSIEWAAFVTQLFNISFMPGSASYMVGQGSSSSGASSTTTSSSSGSSGTSVATTTGSLGGSQYSSLQGTISIWDDLRKALNELKSPEGKIYVAESTTTVTAYDRPANVRAVGNYLAQLNHDMSKEVSIQVQVLELQLNKEYNYGINWNLVQRILGSDVSFAGALADATNIAGSGQGSGTSGVLQLSIGSNRSNALLQALGMQGQLSVVTQPRIVTMNNQLAEIRITRDTAYLQSVSTSTIANASGQSTALTPGLVTDGFTLYLLPKIQDDKVYLQISSDLSMLVSLTEVNNIPKQNGKPVDQKDGDNLKNTGQYQSIQVPTLAQKHFNQRAAVTSGNTLVITGFKQARNDLRSTNLLGTDAVGSKGAQNQNVETVVLITPTIVGNP